MVYLYHNNEPLIALYNYNTNEIDILRIDFNKVINTLYSYYTYQLCLLMIIGMQVGFTPLITTTLKPGGMTHLIECNGFLLGYSGVTGDMVAFQIQMNSKKVVSAAFAPLGRGLTAITSLSSGYLLASFTSFSLFYTILLYVVSLFHNYIVFNEKCRICTL